MKARPRVARLMLMVFLLSLVMGLFPPGALAAYKTDGLIPGKVYRVTASVLNMRSKPSTSGLVKARLPKKELVNYLGTSGNWYKVRTRKGLVGFVQKQYVKYYKTFGSTAKPTPKPTVKPTPAPTYDLNGLQPGKVYRVNANLLNMRSNPNSSARVKAKLPKNELVNYVKTSGSWYKIRTRNGVLGFVQRQYLTYYKTLQSTPKPTQKPTPKPTVKPTVKPTSTPMDIVYIEQKYSYSDMMADLRALKNRYPDRVRIVTIGKTFWGEDIPAVRLGKPASRSILVDGSIHAREYMSTLLIMRQIEYYLARPDETYGGKKISSILDSCNIWFIPMVNPDGVYLSQNGVGSITNSTRKKELLEINGGSSNFTKWKANGRGVDLNRNFSAGWYVDPKHKTADSEGYGGTNPLSEKESKTLVNFLKNYPVRATLNYHTRGNYMYWSYGQTGARRSRDLALAKKISSLTGYWLYKEAEAGSKSGGFMDYFIQQYKLPSFTLELGPSSQDAPQTIDKFSDIWRRNKHVPLLLAQNAP